MWNQTVWPVIPRKQQEKEQPSNEALITELWNQLVSIYALFVSMLSTSLLDVADNGQECLALLCCMQHLSIAAVA